MRTDNRNIKNTIISIYFLLVVFAILFATVFQSFHVFEGSSLYIIISLFLAVLVVHFIARFFEYDSDGTKLIITNQGLILTDYVNYREHKIEIEKDKVLGFKIHNYFFYRSLVVMRKSGDGSTVKERFNISLLKKKKVKYVKQSLRKIIKENKKVKLG
jgi:hypothetical protein